MSAWWGEIHATLRPMLQRMRGDRAASLLYLFASLAINDPSSRHLVVPDADWIDAATERAVAGFGQLQVEDVARLICALAALGHTAKWLPHISVLMETSSATWSKADHSVIKRAWTKMGRLGA